ncbi:MarR family transcriptional regulator [bacterium]|nr:MarR family transcriptional regulator [bacterium]
MSLENRIKQARFSNLGEKAAINLLVASGFMTQKFDAICAEFDITRGQYNVLRILRGVYPEGHPRSEIIDRMIERAPDVTRLLDRLEKQGLAERTSSSEDARLSVARITKKGMKLLDMMAGSIAELDNYLIQRLNDEELVRLSEICEKIYNE